MQSLKIIKIGGRIAEDEQSMDLFLKEFIKMKGPKILVHGGGVIATEVAGKLGIKSEMIEGRRVTNQETLDVVTMVYGGLINKKIVAKLQSLGVNSLGLTGADMNLIKSKKRNPEPVDFGWVGDIENINSEELKVLIERKMTPVLAPLTHDGSGNMLNTNADSITSFVAQELSEVYDVEMIFCLDIEGVMNGSRLITEMNLLLYRHLKGINVIKDGMIPKLDLGFQALKSGVKKVSITKFDSINDLNSGTRLIQ